jgi:hypothetical protein
MSEEGISVTGFCGQYMMMFFNQNLHFLLMISSSIEVDKSMLRTVDSGAVLILDTFLN